MFDLLFITFSLFFVAKSFEVGEVLYKGVNRVNIWVLLEWSTFVIILFPIRRSYLQYKNIDYGVPKTMMLRQTLRRYKSVQVGDYLLATLFIVTITSAKVSSHNMDIALFVIRLLMLLFIFTIIVANLIWRYRYRSIYQ
ncbi:hypothetical protein K5X82_10090 [Halosquirtibacter xylanolyticus]|uniref:hypothetical protein n=1 Tax=Halosquirtibacter xylanolyticus TaxID=3374599 RepID=UPI003749015C|nr:hypothetical protein K5X82_10090 [Prolixibacteraceae bacterium]